MSATFDRPGRPGARTGEVGPAPGSKKQAAAERAAAAVLLQMIWGTQISRAVYAAVELGIVDRLADGPLTAAELAGATHAHQPSLYRVLRLLKSLGVLAEHDGLAFSLTIVGERLRAGVSSSMRSWVMLGEALGGIRALEPIVETVMTGLPGLEIAYGMNVFEYIDRHPERAVRFQAALSERTEALASSVAAEYDFSSVRKVVDVGGGNGVMLAAILRTNPSLNGILLERPTMAAKAVTVLDAADIRARHEIVAGDFFESVPADAECYILANVLHDWDDARAVELLRRCRQAMAPEGRVLIIERPFPDDTREALPILLSDLNMMLLTAGRERTNAEYSRLLEEADLSLGDIRQLAFPFGIIEGLNPHRL